MNHSPASPRLGSSLACRCKVCPLQPLDKYIDEEIDAAVKAFDRKINPMLEFTFGVAMQAAEKAQATTTQPPPQPPRLNVPGTPRGTVAQPVGER
jgi:hypothetical protein